VASPAAELQIGDRTVKVSSPDRVIFEATDWSSAATKLQVVEYYAAVGEGILRALRERPTTLERWPKGVLPGLKLSTRMEHGGDAFFQKRIPNGAPPFVETARIQFPSGRSADEVCPTEVAVVAWAAQMGTITFHPWPVRRTDVDHPDELRIDLDPQPGTDFHDAVRVALVAKELFEDLGMVGFPKTSGNRGVHIYVRIKPQWAFTDVRHAAIAFGRELERRTHGVTTRWWKEERGETVFVDYNQNARDRTIASAYSLRPLPGAPVSTPLTWDELAELSDPRVFNLHTVPQRFAELGDLHAGIDDNAYDLARFLEMYATDEAAGLDDMPYPPEYPKQPGEPKRVQPSRDADRHGG
jgi:DNA ligase D